MRPHIIYCYPIWHTVSFSLIAKKHIEGLRRYTKVYEWDELNLPDIYPVKPYVLLVHPMFWCTWRWCQQLKLAEPSLDRALENLSKRFEKYEKAVGIDVADSDGISDLAVKLTEVYDEVIVPSNFARRSYVRSGVKVPVRVIPHGLDLEWYDSPPISIEGVSNQALRVLWQLKQMSHRKLLLFWMWHSPERKGWPEVLVFYERLKRERDDVALVVKTGGPLNIDVERAKRLGIINVFGWLTEEEKMFLYDICDVTLLFSRGGGFEVCGLESLARGTPAVGHRMGAWAEYMPDWLLCREGLRVRVFPDNQIHVGYGYTVDVDDALDKVHEILEDLAEYRARVREYAVRRLRGVYNWREVGKRLWEVATDGGVPEGG
ncbi:MAG: hypothetical protein DRJ67_06505 [Thermoprotei archaeon]|nr:MAG: hypothetical protein DRJ67_06505 [Thermoprotei archaeon]